MHLKHFGDSYDIVKKSLLHWLSGFGPWAVHPMFTHAVTPDEAAAFSRFLAIPVLSTEVLGVECDRHSYFAPCANSRSVFLDPDTGVRLHRRNGRRSPYFVFGEELELLVSTHLEGLVLTFDQSLARGREAEQVGEKLTHFRSRGLHGFAYVSHASFMVLGQSQVIVGEARAEVLRKSEMPPGRILIPAPH